MPQPLGSLGPNANATASPTPSSSTVVLTYGESDAFQSLPDVAGYAGAIAFPKAPAAAANEPAAKGSPAPAATPVSIAIGATLSVVKPDDGPDLNFLSGKGKKKRSRELPARAIVYVKLLPTHDATLESYPRIALDIPRELASQYRDGEFGLALWNAATKDGSYRMAVAERDTASPPPIERATAKATASPTPSPTPSPSPSGKTNAGVRASAMPSAPPQQTLPPQRIVFAATAAPLKIVANRPLIFALYALPHPSASPTPKPAAASPSAVPSTAPSAAPSASPAPKAT